MPRPAAGGFCDAICPNNTQCARADFSFYTTVAPFYKPQRYRHTVSGVLSLRWTDRRYHFGTDADRADDAGRPSAPWQSPALQCDDHRARPDDDFLHADAGIDRRFRQLVGAADDRGARYGVSATQQPQLLVAGARIYAARQLHLRR